jgi:hypothetical protein
MILKPWLNYKTKKAQKKNKGLRQSIAYKTSSKIGIVFCNDEQSKIENADKLIVLLKKDDKNVKVIAQEPKNGVKHLPYDTFTKENFSFWGDFIGKPINDFVNMEYDFLICLDENPNDLVRSVLANSQAKCRIGKFEEDNQQTFEMLLKDKANNGHNWIDSMYQYIKILS